MTFYHLQNQQTDLKLIRLYFGTKTNYSNPYEFILSITDHIEVI